MIPASLHNLLIMQCWTVLSSKAMRVHALPHKVSDRCRDHVEMKMSSTQPSRQKSRQRGRERERERGRERERERERDKETCSGVTDPCSVVVGT